MARDAPLIFGTPGGSLGDGQNAWAANRQVAAAGRVAEVEVGAVLNKLAIRHGFAVFHDLTLPGTRGNIDHVVLGRNSALVIDSKGWAPGFYATLRGTTWRAPGDVQRDSSGREIRGARRPRVSKFPHADKDWLTKATGQLAQVLNKSGSRVSVRDRALVVATSSKSAEKLHLWAANVPGARLMTLRSFERSARALCPSGRPDSISIGALRALVR